MKFIAKTLYGLEQVLANELITLGADQVEAGNRAVMFSGDLKLLYTVNYCSRVALSVLMNVAEFRIRSKDDLFKRGMAIEWDRFMDVDKTFSIAPVINSPHFAHTGYAGLVLKDAIADYFRKRTSQRPSVNTVDPDLRINLHISNDQVSISLDSSVIPLFKRGYRKEQTVAPLNEVLAAGILLLSGWNAAGTLTDPMCGSGTIPIEAGLIACKIPPGKFRSYFGFQKWKDYDIQLFQKVKSEADSQIQESPVRISGSDILETAVGMAKANVSRAGLADVVSVDVADFKNITAIDDHGWVFINPPYGLRLEDDEISTLYGMIGTTLKHNFQGSTAWIISSNKESLKHVGLKHKEKLTLYNGALECTLLKYEMYQGSKKRSSNH
jgi:putative N6-adenine-specific DNA methylase